MLDPVKDVQGIATYVELRREAMGQAASTQLLITPDGYRSDGLFVPATVYRRTVDKYSPKRQWRSNRITIASTDEASKPIEDKEARTLHAEARLEFLAPLLRQLTHGAPDTPTWTIVGEPLFIEVSKRDLDDVSASKTPSKLVYRITQSRTAKKFPENLYA